MASSGIHVAGAKHLRVLLQFSCDSLVRSTLTPQPIRRALDWNRRRSRK
jgi:hypothetical protein